MGALENARQALHDRENEVLISPDAWAEVVRDLLPLAEKGKAMSRPSHEELVLALAKPGDAILQTLTPEKVDLWHMATGVSGEAGELLDWVKKHVVYNQSLDTVSKEGKTLMEHISEEMEDAAFYMKKIMIRFGWTWKDLEERNITKLLKRYDGMVYTDAAAKDRADKPS